jgi:hypothetical protein
MAAPCTTKLVPLVGARVTWEAAKAAPAGPKASAKPRQIMQMISVFFIGNLPSIAEG